MSLPSLDVDVLVMGGGAAGLTAASRLALNGRSVAVASSATPATALSTGRILLDVDDPAAEEWASFTLAQFRRQGAYYVMSKKPVVAMTNLGTRMRQSITSPLFDWTRTDRNVAVVGFIGNCDLDPDLVAREVGRSRRARPRPYWFSPSYSPELDRDLFVEELGRALMQDVSEETVVLPPMPQRSPYDIMAELRKRSGKNVVEAATPLSWPGRRLQSLLEGVAARLGVTLLKDRRLASIQLDGGEASAAQLSSGGRSQRVDFNALVLATGNVTSGGLAVEGRDIVDPLGIFQVASSPASGIASRHLLSALSSGMVTRDGKAVTRQGSTLRNVIPVGSLVRGMSYPLGRGLGDVVLQAWKAALVAEDAL